MLEDYGVRKTVWFKSEQRYQLFKELCEALGVSLSEELNLLIEKDIQDLIKIVETYKQEKKDD
jgi:hypothetical protein